MKELRLEGGMTQLEFGSRLGVSFQQVQKYERGLNSVTIEMLLRAAKILKVSLYAFWQDDNEPLPSANIYPSPDRGVVSLVKSYKRISNPKIRKKLLEIVNKVAEADHLINKK